LSHPFIAGEEKRRMIHSALGEYATPLLERFFALLIQRRRFALLFAIAQEFQEEVDLDQNVEAIRVRSAMPMSETQKKQLKTELEKWLGAKVRMDVQIDSSLIGGVVIQTRDRVLDQSLSGQLKELQQQLTV
jgi:F-type H+-transporting ATPase subunit delta